MSGPLPKDPALRRRTNKPATRAVLCGWKRRVPPLPKLNEGEAAPRMWHALTRAWWRDVWRSPMASAFLTQDLHGLYILARLVDDFWTHPSKELAAEIRLQRQCFGLTPIDRRRLDWQVEEDGTEDAKRAFPAAAAAPPPACEPIEDPRKLLRVVGA